MKKLYILLLSALFVAYSCGEDPIEPVVPDDPKNEQPAPKPEDKTGISNVVNSYEDKLVSYRGTTVSVKFDASASWTASLEMLDAPEEEWVSFVGTSSSGEAKEGCTIRLDFEKNNTASERSVELWVTVEGFDAECIAVLKQASAGTSVDAELNKALNTYMHEILTKDYLFNDAYNAQEIDLTVGYNDFLSQHLLSLGEANVEDGGYYRASQSNAGQRFIYTNLVELQMGTRAIQTTGLGFGPFLSTPLADGSSYIGIAPGFVRRGSPAEAAGMRRGDIIYAVNGIMLTSSNYYNMMTTLYQNPSGTYKFSFLRFEENGAGGYELKEYESGSATASVHVYDPVLHASVLNSPEDPSVKIGYLVYESFDLNSQDLLEDAIHGFVEAGITEMILDLRFNAGGAVAQSRWLSGCIAGEENGDKTFVKVIYNDGKTENWKFDYGYNNDTDPLGKPVDLGLDRLYVITSYNTASAAELVINSLKGIDFPVKMIGCNTEGKNVGMVVSEKDYNGRRFQFSPVTFWVRNAKDFGDYGFGMQPDEYVNNDNVSYNDDADNVFPYSFSDWGNMDYNIALQWAYCDITGLSRWTHAPTRAASAMSLIPGDFQPMELQHGRFGNLVYEKQ